MRKIAIMILAHKNEKQLNRLVKHLSKDFDIYVHIDKRSPVNVEVGENVFVYKKYKSYWGSFNQIMTVLFLLKQAYSKGYERYLLISGDCLPLRTNKEITAFFNENNREYLEGHKLTESEYYRVTKYWPNRRFHKYRGEGSPLMRILTKFESAFFVTLSKIKTRPVDYEFYAGATKNWLNFTHNCVGKIMDYLEKNPQYIRRFKWTVGCDEVFFHTIMPQLTELDVVNKCLVYMYENYGHPPQYAHTLRKEDYELLQSLSKDYLFARKFEMQVDSEIIEMMYKQIEK